MKTLIIYIMYCPNRTLKIAVHIGQHNGVEYSTV